MSKKLFLWASCLLWIVAACSPQTTNSEQLAALPTVAVFPTLTPSDTPTITLTPLPSNTHTATFTATPNTPTTTSSPTPTATITNTSLPTATVTKTPPPSETSTPRGYIRKEDYGDAWPFTVDDGIVECLVPNRVIFRTGGRIYAINGTARSFMDESARDDMDEIWRDDPNGIMPKVDISPIIDMGLDLCD